MNRLFPPPEWKLREDTQSSFYIFRTDTQQVLAKGVVGYDNAKQRASYLRKRHGLKFDQVRFKKERVATGRSSGASAGLVVRPIGEDAATPQGPTTLPDENILDKFITLPSNGDLD